LRQTKLLKADLHIHTEYSLDCETTLEQIINRCQEQGINCIAIADHGNIEGALKMRAIAPFEVIVAEEILTPKGEIMGMFLTEGIPSGLSVEQAISQIKAQGALVCAPHPFDVVRRCGLGPTVLESVIEQIDIIEVFNARSIFPQSSAKALALAKKYGIAQSTGSDAHTVHEIGNTYIKMPEFNGKDEFLKALAEGKIFRHRTSPLFHFASAWAKLKGRFK